MLYVSQICLMFEKNKEINGYYIPDSGIEIQCDATGNKGEGGGDIVPVEGQFKDISGDVSGDQSFVPSSHSEEKEHIRNDVVDDSKQDSISTILYEEKNSKDDFEVDPNPGINGITPQEPGKPEFQFPTGDKSEKEHLEKEAKAATEREHVKKQPEAEAEREHLKKEAEELFEK